MTSYCLGALHKHEYRNTGHLTSLCGLTGLNETPRSMGRLVVMFNNDEHDLERVQTTKLRHNREETSSTRSIWMLRSIATTGHGQRGWHGGKVQLHPRPVAASLRFTGRRYKPNHTQLSVSIPPLPQTIFSFSYALEQMTRLIATQWRHILQHLSDDGASS